MTAPQCARGSRGGASDSPRKASTGDYSVTQSCLSKCPRMVEWLSRYRIPPTYSRRLRYGRRKFALDTFQHGNNLPQLPAVPVTETHKTLRCVEAIYARIRSRPPTVHYRRVLRCTVPRTGLRCGYNIQPPQAIHTCQPLSTRPLALPTTVECVEDDLIVPSCMEHATKQQQRRETLNDEPASSELMSHTCASTISPRFWLYGAFYFPT